MNGSHLDLINAINSITKNVKFEVVGLSGNQDDYCMHKQLDWRGKHNVDMDLLAKSMMYEKRTKKIKNTNIGISAHTNVVVIINKI